MPIVGSHQKCTAPGSEAARTSATQCEAGVIITGSCVDSTFEAVKILILADTLGDERAIRSWLDAHGIRVAG
jgi:hypothetical protein